MIRLRFEKRSYPSFGPDSRTRKKRSPEFAASIGLSYDQGTKSLIHTESGERFSIEQLLGAELPTMEQLQSSSLAEDLLCMTGLTKQNGELQQDQAKMEIRDKENNSEVEEELYNKMWSAMSAIWCKNPADLLSEIGEMGLEIHRDEDDNLNISWSGFSVTAKMFLDSEENGKSINGYLLEELVNNRQQNQGLSR